MHLILTYLIQYNVYKARLIYEQRDDSFTASPRFPATIVKITQNAITNVTEPDDRVLYDLYKKNPIFITLNIELRNIFLQIKNSLKTKFKF